MNAPDALTIANPGPVLLPDTGPGRDRTKYLGGSDIAALMGLSKWSTPLQLWEKKTGRFNEVITPEKKKLFDRGHRWEEPAFLMLVDELESRGFTVEVVGTSRRYADGVHSFLECELDREILLSGEVNGRMLVRELVNVEIKSVHVFAAAEWGEGDTDEIPVYYGTQVMHGLGITGRRLTVCGALFGADYIVPYFVERDQETIDVLRERAIDFWSFVLTDIAPDPINMEDMLRLFARRNGKPADVDEDTALALADLANCRTQIKTFEGNEEDLKLKVCKGIRRAWGLLDDTEPDDNAIIRFNGLEIGSWKKQSRNTIDSKALRDKYPAIAEECNRESHTRVLKTKKLK